MLEIMSAHSTQYRLGNALMINIGCSIIAKKLNLKVLDYPPKHHTDSMEVELFNEGEIYQNIIELSDIGLYDNIYHCGVGNLCPPAEIKPEYLIKCFALLD